GITEQAQEVGLEMEFSNMVHTNTFQAHRLVKYANKKGKENVLIDLLFEKYFNENENVGRREVLFQSAVEVGLNMEEVDAFLCLNKYAKDVRNDQQLANELGITGVPFFIFNEEYAISGAQPTDVFLNVLKELWEEEKESLKSVVQNENTC